jgi:hypothetical protein
MKVVRLTEHESTKSLRGYWKHSESAEMPEERAAEGK